jgi:hypothetical protein
MLCRWDANRTNIGTPRGSAWGAETDVEDARPVLVGKAACDERVAPVQARELDQFMK